MFKLANLFAKTRQRTFYSKSRWTGKIMFNNVKYQNTCLEKYKVNNVSKSWLVKQKIRYKLTENLEFLIKRLDSVHCKRVFIDGPTYINHQTKARFIDVEYGEWWCKPYQILQGHGHPDRAKKNRQTKYTAEDMYSRIHVLFDGKIILDKESYVNINKECFFYYSGYGKFFAKPSSVIRGYTNLQIGKKKAEITNLLKYGVLNPMQNKDIALKSAKSSNNSCVLFHWKTNEELVCVGSYEKKVVEWLNENKIDFQWQSQIFKMPNGKTYRPDLYLVKEDRWVEIKGWLDRKNGGKEKWEWFQGMYPNSELWDANRLKEIKIFN